MRDFRRLSMAGLLLGLVLAACTSRQPQQAAPQGPADAPPPVATPAASAERAAVPAPVAPATDTPPSAPPKQTKSSDCPAKRPEICTQQYQPVCANVDTGVRCIKAPCPSEDQKEFSNWCVACTNPKVRSYVDGPCPGGGPRPSPESMPQ